MVLVSAPSSSNHHYGFTKPPPRLQTSLAAAESFYTRRSGLSHFAHCKDVLDGAIGVGIVEPRVIDDQKETFDRRWANSILADLILYHVLNSNFRTVSPLPPALRHAELKHELDKFCQIIDLERSGAPLSDFIPLLNNSSRPPLALLARLADYIVTHDHAERLDGLITTKPSAFRVYDSMDAVQHAMRMDAKAAEALWAPIAELFGYPPLAGTIFQHAYQINHPEIHDLVARSTSSAAFRKRLELTQRSIADLTGRIQHDLRESGLDATISMRPMKHIGKIMRKVWRYVVRDFEEMEKRINAPEAGRDERRAAYIAQYGGLFSLERIHDWVTFRVILNAHQGQSLSELPNGRVEDAMQIANRIMTLQIERQVEVLRTVLRADGNPIDMVTTLENHRKANGYCADHWDTVLDRGDGVFPNTPLSFEVQLMTSASYQNAEKGGAAHYLYIGGNPDLMRTVDAAYHDILNNLLGSNGSSKKK